MHICVCVSVCARCGVKGCVTWAALDNRPLHALIRTRVEQTVLGAGEGWRVLAQEGISGKNSIAKEESEWILDKLECVQVQMACHSRHEVGREIQFLLNNDAVIHR